MLNKIWRYSHFALAVSSSIFVLLAAITGIFLAFEPIENQMQDYSIKGMQDLPLSPVIDSLRNHYDEVFELEITEDNFVKSSVVNMGKDINGEFYIQPFTGEILSPIPSKRPLYEFMTNLHRSLFLKQTGRLIIGITSFFLFLIAITGSLLLIKRQNGIRHVLKKIPKEDKHQFYHILLGKWTLIPILIISFTGVYLSLYRFELLPKNEAIWYNAAEYDHNERGHGNVLEGIHLSEVKKVEFPFSEDEEDYFIINLHHETLKVNQYTGEIVEYQPIPQLDRFSTTSFNLHTGRGSVLWSIVLLIASINILYFLYSGAMISYKRLRSKIKNKYSSDEAEIIVLVGSENGSTLQFGKILQESLHRINKKAFVANLNDFRRYKAMKDLVVLTSTYGEGDPPANALNFLSELKQNGFPNPVDWAVVGFGSYAYSNFCQFAKEVDHALSQQVNAKSATPICLIHNKSYTDFKSWATSWSKEKGLRLELPTQLSKTKSRQYSYFIEEKKCVQDGYGETFTLLLKSNNNKFQSGDLLGITPPSSQMERWYSVARIDKNRILLSIKKHKEGLCSQYLSTLYQGDVFQASVQKNKEFHFPEKAKKVFMISNGTGIAPFIGMLFKNIHTPNLDIHFYWGGKSQKSYALYEPWLEEVQSQGVLTSLKIAYSRSESCYKYVQEAVERDKKIIINALGSGATIMICGAIAMQKDVLKTLENESQILKQKSLNKYLLNGQIKADCY